MRDSLKTKQIRLKQLTASFRKYPSLLTLGFAKCGTTSFYNYLIRHPQISAPFKKEIDYFDRHAKKPLSWYRTHFPLNFDSKITIDVSPNIIHEPSAIKKMTKQFPNMKYCVLVREPVSRAISGYLMNKRQGLEDRSFDKAVRDEIKGVVGYPSYVITSAYSQHIEHFLQYVKRKNLLIIDLDDLNEYPNATMNIVYGFIGIDHFAHMDYPVYNKGKTKMQIDPETEKLLKSYFRPYNERLSKLMGKELNW